MNTLVLHIMGGLNMEVLNNFISIYCLITFIIGAMFMFTTFCIAAMCKMQEPKNKVHFYVARDKYGSISLYMGKPFRSDTEFYADSKKRVFCLTYNIDYFGLKHEDFDYLKWEDEPVEVFLNLED